jgi:hypothetical protein
VLLYPRLGRKVVVPWAASIFIDVDHYLYYCVRERSVHPVKAVRFFNQTQPPRHSGTRVLHHPAVLLLLALTARWRWAQLLLLGMVFHVGLDVYHGARMRAARQSALRRDDDKCQHCGARRADVVAHLFYQPRVLPSYRAEYLVSLCGECHELAHQRGMGYIRATAVHGTGAPSPDPCETGDVRDGSEA